MIASFLKEAFGSIGVSFTREQEIDGVASGIYCSILPATRR